MNSTWSFEQDVFPHTKFELFEVAKLNEPLYYLMKISQKQSFEKEIAALFEEKSVLSKSRVSTLETLMDKEGILRVGGRLQ